MDVSPIEDDEDLYRSVPVDKGHFHYAEDGRLVISAPAFSDRRKRPSVDRAKLCNYDAHASRKQQDAGVVKVVAKAVRDLTPMSVFDGKRQIASAIIDIEHVPIEGQSDIADNPAHAEIFAASTTGAPLGNGFHRRLCEALARLATEEGWVLRPTTSVDTGD